MNDILWGVGVFLGLSVAFPVMVLIAARIYCEFQRSYDAKYERKRAAYLAARSTSLMASEMVNKVSQANWKEATAIPEPDPATQHYITMQHANTKDMLTPDQMVGNIERGFVNHADDVYTGAVNPWEHPIR